MGSAVSAPNRSGTRGAENRQASAAPSCDHRGSAQRLPPAAPPAAPPQPRGRRVFRSLLPDLATTEYTARRAGAMAAAHVGGEGPDRQAAVPPLPLDERRVTTNAQHKKFSVTSSSSTDEDDDGAGGDVGAGGVRIGDGGVCAAFGGGIRSDRLPAAKLSISEGEEEDNSDGYNDFLQRQRQQHQETQSQRRRPSVATHSDVEEESVLLSSETLRFATAPAPPPAAPASVVNSGNGSVAFGIVPDECGNRRGSGGSGFNERSSGGGCGGVSGGGVTAELDGEAPCSLSSAAERRLLLVLRHGGKSAGGGGAGGEGGEGGGDDYPGSPGSRSVRSGRRRGSSVSFVEPRSPHWDSRSPSETRGGSGGGAPESPCISIAAAPHTPLSARAAVSSAVGSPTTVSSHRSQRAVRRGSSAASLSALWGGDLGGGSSSSAPPLSSPLLLAQAGRSREQQQGTTRPPRTWGGGGGETGGGFELKVGGAGGSTADASHIVSTAAS